MLYPRVTAEHQLRCQGPEEDSAKTIHTFESHAIQIKTFSNHSDAVISRFPQVVVTSIESSSHSAIIERLYIVRNECVFKVSSFSLQPYQISNIHKCAIFSSFLPSIKKINSTKINSLQYYNLILTYQDISIKNRPYN